MTQDWGQGCCLDDVKVLDTRESSKIARKLVIRTTVTKGGRARSVIPFVAEGSRSVWFGRRASTYGTVAVLPLGS